MSTKGWIKCTSVALGVVVGIIALVALLPFEGKVPIQENLEWVPRENSLTALEGYATGRPKTDTTLTAIKSLTEDGYPAYLLLEVYDGNVVVTWILQLPEEILFYKETFYSGAGLTARDPKVDGNTLYAPTYVSAVDIFWIVVVAAVIWVIVLLLLYGITYGAFSLVSTIREGATK